MVIPPEILDALARGGRPAVRATINGCTYRGSVGRVSERSMLGGSRDARRAAGVAAGDEVDFHIELDTARRIVDVPSDFAAMAAAPNTRRTFDGLTYSFPRRYVDQLIDAKSPKTGARGVAEFVEELRAGGPKR